MTLIDLIEFLGPSVDEGLITMDEAAEWVADSSRGGLTVRGARRALSRHRTVRADRRQIIDDTRSLIVAITAVRDASTPGEHAVAKLALDVEVTLQQAATRERNRARLKQRLLDNNFPCPPNGEHQ